MEIVEEKQGEVVILAPGGRVDSASSGQLEAALLKSLGAGPARLAVDLASVEYISSAGLRVLLMLVKKMRGGGGRLVLCAMPESVRLVFELAGFLPLFEIEDSREAAVARLEAGSSAG
jgi:stage II sporulation protein AA (anti-sigma F factor antagonist)